MSQQTNDFYFQYPQFIGKLLQDVSESFHHEDLQSSTILPELAGLWIAVASVIGLHLLQRIVLQFQGLQELVIQKTSLLQNERAKNAATEKIMKLRIGSLLHSFMVLLKAKEAQTKLQQKYIRYLERTEQTFNGLVQERQKEMIDDTEHKKEVEALYLQSLYMLTRLPQIEK